MIQERKLTALYVLTDLISTSIALLLFNIFRYSELPVAYTSFASLKTFLLSGMVIVGQIGFPLLMLGLYYLSGFYNSVALKSRSSELTTTLATAAIGTLVLVFAFLINDLSTDKARDYSLFSVVFLLLFVIVYIPRLIITTSVKKRIALGEIFFNTALVGFSSEPQLWTKHISELTPRSASKPTLLIDSDNNTSPATSAPGRIPQVNLSEADEAIRKNNIDRIIIIPHPDGWEKTLSILNRIFPLNIPIFVSASSLPVFFFKTNLSNLHAEPFIDISKSSLPASTLNLKRASDIAVSVLAILLLGVPVGLIALWIKLDSPGPAFYKQKRAGLHGRLFTIYKLRTMTADAEKEGIPLLSSTGDTRITSIGRILRKYRIDELPQFVNILRGDMSLVGPRPERTYYIEQIMKAEPSYALVHRVRPGLTSLGMVKYGYASTVEQMIQRLRFDLIYLENISFVTDLKIILNTISTVLRGKGV